jgi:hypothetical protein
VQPAIYIGVGTYGIHNRSREEQVEEVDGPGEVLYSQPSEAAKLRSRSSPRGEWQLCVSGLFWTLNITKRFGSERKKYFKLNV